MFSKLVIPSVVLIAPALGEWHTVFSCVGGADTDRVSLDNVDVIASKATGLRMCSMGSETECVVAKIKNEALDLLRDGKYDIQPDREACDLDCIKERWTGPEELLKALTWSCKPASDRYIYQACGNAQGVHFDSVSTGPPWGGPVGHGDPAGLCSWRFKSGGPMAMTIQVDAPLYWHTVFGCEGFQAGERVKHKKLDEVASNAFGLRVCSTGSEKCLVATDQNQGLRSLAAGELSIMPPSMDSCDFNCVDEHWKGTGEMKRHMSWKCKPDRDSFYHACGNGGGLHLDAVFGEGYHRDKRNSGTCGWGWKVEHAISVQLLVMYDASYTKEANTCVTGGTIEEHSGLTIGECQAMCSEMGEKCKAVSYGVDYGSPTSLMPPGDCVLQSSDDTYSKDCDGLVNADVYIKGDYGHFPQFCVDVDDGTFVGRFSYLSLQECQDKCDAHYQCVAFEYGVALKSTGSHLFHRGDCTLQRSYYLRDCDMADVYVKHAATPRPTPDPTPRPTPKPTPAPEQRDFERQAGDKPVQKNVCFGGKDGKYGEFTLSRDAAVTAIYLVHRSGGVHNSRFPKKHCADDVKFGSSGQGTSNFGGECHGAVSVYVTDNADNTVAPNGQTAGFAPNSDSVMPSGESAWYTLSGFNSHSKYLAFKFDSTVEMSAGTYRIWHGEDLFNFHEYDNTGSSCVDVYAAEAPPALPQVDDGSFYRVAENVCVGAKDDTFGRFKVPFGTLTAKRVKIVHRSGYVNCKRWTTSCPQYKDTREAKSNFGCDCLEELVIMITNDDNKLVVPRADYPLWSNTRAYKLDGYNSHSKEIVFHDSYVFSTGSYRLWYGEDLRDLSEADNHGTACYDILADVDINAGF